MGWLLFSTDLLAQTGEGFEKASMAWRTALHFDPGAEAPLRSLVELYQKEGRVADLLDLYTRHLAQYPQDENAMAVLARLYVALKEARAESFLQEALRQHPQSALLHHVQAGWLAQSYDARAIEVLDAAVKLETQVPARRAQWLGELIKAAAEAGRDEVVVLRFTELGKGSIFTSTQRLQWARRCLEAGLKGGARAALAGGDFSTLTGEEAVEARFVQARVALANDERAAAATHARTLLGLLAADHWRRKEALLLHWQTADDAQRAAALAESEAAWKAAPANESLALSCGDVFIMAGRRDEALNVWQETLKTLPASRLIEERIIDLLQSLRREEALLAFLAERVRLQPEREDLRLNHARRLLQLGRVDEGLRALQALLEKSDAAQRVTTHLQTARWLRLQNLFGEAARVLEVALAVEPQRWDVRKELAEIFLLVKRETEAENLFDLEMSDDVSAEVRMEGVQFLIARRLWPQARRHLESWVKRKPTDFDAKLLLARVESLTGSVKAEAILDECRKLCDTEARYAAWLAVVWERATELETTASFIDAERKQLWPKAGETWDVLRLQKLGLLAGQTMQSQLQVEAEMLLREALKDSAIPAAAKMELRQQLIATLDGREDQRKALELEIQAALAEKVDSGDLRLRLALMYLDAERLDLARSTLHEVVVERCEDAALIQRSIMAARQMEQVSVAIELSQRLVRLQPDERAHWLGWTSLLVESGDESSLRLALREMRARASAWKLGEVAQEMLRRHLAASAWRTVSAALSDTESSTDEALLCLGDLEQTEQQPQRRLWLAWARGMLALRAGDEVGLADARTALSVKEDWVIFPDGLSLSLAEARRMLETTKPDSQKVKPRASGNYSEPGTLKWSFEPMTNADFQRWCLTPDGDRMLAQDTQSRIYAVDRASGKLLWQKRLNAKTGGVSAMMLRGGSEQVSYPLEWSVGDEHVVVLDESGMTCLRVVDGTLVWQIDTPPAAAGTQGALAEAGGRVLWWRAAASRLDALDARSGKLLWTRQIPALGQKEALNPGNPVWLMSGIRCDGDRAMVWGNGTAVVRLSDGALLWKASAGEAPLSFPLQLDEAPVVKNAATAPGAMFLSAGMRSRSFSGGGLTPTILGSALALPSYGYPGMYGSTQGSPWLLWGGDGERWLQGDGVWLLGQNMASARYSVLGFPMASSRGRNSTYLGSATPMGTAGRSLIVASERALYQVLPDGQGRTLAMVEVRDNSPAKHPLPAMGMDGTSLLFSTVDELCVIDALSGTKLWKQSWSADAAKIVTAARESLKSWQSLRWSSRGMAFYDGRGRTLMMEWRALMADGDVILPAGTRALICLRCSGR